ncbi:hypothetical protein BDZ94DRAFT_1312222 [Collybia nuda]|uniref:Uncharacterized protein n=1 Tax=Collybia nuda TaxID=64659 RepID=A0A9P5Y1H4_9AGAR|nr:hypothetical protein BDZ94DRAFT_1312222 [Collybia nuda]
MAPPQLPQDIIDEIVRHLCRDTITLKACSIASRTFFPPSRRALFSRIVLETPRSLLRLNHLLEQSSEISKLVYTVHIHNYIISLISTPSVSTVLQLPQLRHLIIGNDNNYFDWSYIPPENAGTLETLITSGNLHSLEFICAYHVPTSLIRAASSITSLTLEVSVLYDDTNINDPPVPNLTNLEALHLGFEVVLGLSYWEPFTTPNLHQLSILGTERQTLKNMQNILIAASSSIQNIIWREYSFSPYVPHSQSIDLGILSNLRFLSFVTSDYSRLDSGSSEATWRSIINILKDSTVVKNIQRLSVVITTSRMIASDTPSSALFGIGDILWNEIDTVLTNMSRPSKSCQVYFYLDYVGWDGTTREQSLCTTIRERLPVLNHSKLLFINSVQDLDWRILL